MATRTITTNDKDGNVLSSETVTVPDSDTNRDAILDGARQALATNRAFVTAAKPGTAAAVADAAYTQAKALTRQTNGIIRLLLGLVDGTD
jgi:hypothetical protein